MSIRLSLLALAVAASSASAQISSFTTNNFAADITPVISAGSTVFSGRVKSDATNWDIMLDDDGGFPFATTAGFSGPNRLPLNSTSSFVLSYDGSLVTLTTRGKTVNYTPDPFVGTLRALVLEAIITPNANRVTANSEMTLSNLVLTSNSGTNTLTAPSQVGPGADILYVEDASGLGNFTLTGDYFYANPDNNRNDTRENIKFQFKGIAYPGDVAPIPEPGTIAAVAFGALGLLVFLRRRR